MKERPILFSGAMVRAILEGRKTQTRRVVKDQPSASMTDAVAYLDNATWCFTGPQRDGDGNPLPIEQWKSGWPDCGPGIACPYGVPGDRLWVRETFRWVEGTRQLAYSADRAPHILREMETLHQRWKPSIHMPRWASRITLEITDVRVQRLQEIGEDDAQCEGVDSSVEGKTYRYGFSRLWDSINAKRGYGWDANPWVWAISFQKLA